MLHTPSCRFSILAISWWNRLVFSSLSSPRFEKSSLEFKQCIMGTPIRLNALRIFSTSWTQIDVCYWADGCLFKLSKQKHMNHDCWHIYITFQTQHNNLAFEKQDNITIMVNSRKLCILLARIHHAICARWTSTYVQADTMPVLPNIRITLRYFSEKLHNSMNNIILGLILDKE